MSKRQNPIKIKSKVEGFFNPNYVIIISRSVLCFFLIFDSFTSSKIVTLLSQP